MRAYTPHSDGVRAVKVVGHNARRIADHGVADLADGRRRVGPSLVAEVRVGRHAVDFHAHRLEVGIVVGEVFQLGRAHKGEVRRIKEENRPFALHVGIGDGDELAVLIGRCRERLDLGVDDRHRNFVLILVSRIGRHGCRGAYLPCRLAQGQLDCPLSMID
jgi:hypothetical protein